MQKLWGKHTLKAGYDHRRYYSNLYSAFGAGVGSFTESRCEASPRSRTTIPIPLEWDLLPGCWASLTTGSGSSSPGPPHLQPYHGALHSGLLQSNTEAHA